MKGANRHQHIAINRKAAMKKFIQTVILGSILTLPFAFANGDVNLIFTPSTNTVASGGTFNVTLSLQITGAEQVATLNYYFQQLSAAGFFIVSRNMTGSPFNDPYFSNAQVASGSDQGISGGGGFNGEADNALNPRNDLDLGAVASPVGTTVTTGTHLVGTFSIGYLGAAAPGTQFTISTISNAGTGWGDLTVDHPFSNHASMIITIVPEPATWSLLGLSAIGAFGLNLLRARARR